VTARRLAAAAALAAGLLTVASPAAAHPLGNATVSRALAVEMARGEARIIAVVDMAEIPAFATILEIDTDGDGTLSAGERQAWAAAECRATVGEIMVAVDDRGVAVTATDAWELSFPPGIGELETLRLVCRFTAAIPDDGGRHRIAVVDRAEDGRRGWREVTIGATREVELLESDVPSVSPSALLTRYPDDLLTTPVDVRSGSASYGPASGAGSPVVAPPTGDGRPEAAPDPLADLVAAPRTPMGWLAALALAVGLGAAHALSPGHGKALIAAYAVGSRSTMGHAVGLGLSAAASHTIGVLVLGAIVLTAGELLVPERVVAWLSVASGVGVVLVGGMVAGRALRRPARPGRGSGHGHAHAHGDGEEDHRHHHHGPDIGRDHHDHPGAAHDAPHPTRPPLHEIITLGLVGGAIPSTSALLVLLVAVATGQVVQGLLLILAFGGGMALVLGGLAAVTGLARSRLTRTSGRIGRPAARRLAGAAPIASAVVIMAVGAVTAIGALGSLL
jgi:ABC-type nickel/cobalt efflux system permease component RcnA